MRSDNSVPPGRAAAAAARAARRLGLIGAVVAAGLAFWVGVPWVERTFLVGEFEFTALEEPAGFRRISGGEVSGAGNPLAGFAAAGASDAAPLEAQDFCRALFGTDGPDAGTVPIAYFSDYRCPYCRVLSDRLAELASAGADIAIVWHEWPIFGEPSELAARAALAAKRQGAYDAFHRRLMQTSFVPTPAYLESVSARIGIDAERLATDMQSAAVERELGETRALAAAFGFPGTPGLVVGRTVVVGAIDGSRLQALIEHERAEGPVAACR